MSSDGVNFAKALENLHRDFTDILRAKITNKPISYGETFSSKFCLIAIDEIGDTLKHIASKVIDSRILYEICVSKLIKYWEKLAKAGN